MTELSQRALNRAMLERQLLLRRVRMPALEAVEHLVGLQAQLTHCPYGALWARLDGFTLEELSADVDERRAVRAVLMRGTIHLVSAADAGFLWPKLLPVMEQVVYPNATYGGPLLEGLDVAAVLAAGRELLLERPLTAAQLRELLAPQWPDRDPAALAYAVRVLSPLVHVPPRGIYGRSGPIAFAPMDDWLGEQPSDDSAPDTMVLRYLAAFGPATPADAQTWSSLRGLREVFERLRPQLRVFRDERGRELFDLPDAPRPDPDTPAPVRLLPEFDNLYLSHADRSRVIREDYRKRIQTRNGLFPGSFTVDGYMRGSWTVEKAGTKGPAVLRVQPFEPLTPAQAEELEAEAVRMFEFLHAERETREVQVLAPG